MTSSSSSEEETEMSQIPVWLTRRIASQRRNFSTAMEFAAYRRTIEDNWEQGSDNGSDNGSVIEEADDEDSSSSSSSNNEEEQHTLLPLRPVRREPAGPFIVSIRAGQIVMNIAFVIRSDHSIKWKYAVHLPYVGWVRSPIYRID